MNILLKTKRESLIVLPWKEVIETQISHVGLIKSMDIESRTYNLSEFDVSAIVANVKV